MAILLGAQGLAKSFGARPLFTGLAFTVEDGERIGLIGPNGAGKSTLLRVLAGRSSPDEGSLAPRRGLRVGFVEQVPAFAEGATVWSSLLEHGREDPHEEDWRRDERIRDVLARLGFEAAGYDEQTPVAELSGGWRKRVALGRELCRGPELLLLDEPTNHLDVEGIEWLEALLSAAPFATVTVTHDRVFLQRVTNRILELDRRHPGGLLSVKGGYQRYLEVRAEALASQERRETVLRNTLRREIEWLSRGPPARTTKQQARIDRADAVAGEVAELTLRNRTRTAELEFTGTGKVPRRLVEARGVGKAYGARALFAGEDVALGPGVRLGLLGANGCGKSTLIRVLVGSEPPDSGVVLRADNLQVAYFEQNREALDPAQTVTDAVCPGGDYVDAAGTRMHVRGYLDRFLFSSDQLGMQVGKLSGGEQSRLLIARLMLRPANLLVLDEPTNDLDTATLAVLEDCLKGFAGAVLLVTHDRYFLDQVATEIVAFPPLPPGGGPAAAPPLERFASVAQWERWHRQAVAALQPAAGKGTQGAAGGKDRPRRLGYKEQRELDGMEAAITAAEAALAALVAESEHPDNVANAAKLVELTTKIAEAQARVDALYGRWADLERRASGQDDD